MMSEDKWVHAFDKHSTKVVWTFSVISLAFSALSVFLGSWLFAAASVLALYFAWEVRLYIRDVLGDSPPS